MGPELMSNFRAQAERFGAELLTKKVTRVNLHTSPFEVWVGDPSSNEPTFTAESIIVSTGAKALMLNLPKEIELVGMAYQRVPLATASSSKIRRSLLLVEETQLLKKQCSSRDLPAK